MNINVGGHDLINTQVCLTNTIDISSWIGFTTRNKIKKLKKDCKIKSFQKCYIQLMFP